MKCKAINIFIYLICLVLITIYLLCFSLVFNQNITYSYKMYYKETKTKYWHGYDGLIVNFDEVYRYNDFGSIKSDLESKGFQYLGKDFNFVFDAFEVKSIPNLNKIEIDESSTIYYEMPKNRMMNYKVIIEVDYVSENNISFLLNNDKIGNIEYEDGRYTLLIENVRRENALNIRSQKKLALKSLCFKEVA